MPITCIYFVAGPLNALFPRRGLTAITLSFFDSSTLRIKGNEIIGPILEIGFCEIGTVMFGRQPDGSEKPAAMDLVRLAVPRRTYTQSHIDYVIEVVERVAAKAGDLVGMEITYEPERLRHFTARFRPLSAH